MMRIVILCTANLARSQMAEGLLRSMAGDRFAVFSAGTKPSFVRPEAIVAMRELGVDLSSHRSKSVDEYRDASFDYVITVCDNANESCLLFAGKAERIHWTFEDPAAVDGDEETRVGSFRKIRDRIAGRMRSFVEDTDESET